MLPLHSIYANLPIVVHQQYGRYNNNKHLLAAVIRNRAKKKMICRKMRNFEICRKITSPGIFILKLAQKAPPVPGKIIRGQAEICRKIRNQGQLY